MLNIEYICNRYLLNIQINAFLSGWIYDVGNSKAEDQLGVHTVTRDQIARETTQTFLQIWFVPSDNQW